MEIRKRITRKEVRRLDLSFITDLYVPTIVAACLVIGYCIKHAKKLNAVCNDYIPILMVVLGMTLSVSMSLLAGDAITVQSVTAGAVSGLASTGLHQVFKGIINQTNEKENGKWQ